MIQVKFSGLLDAFEFVSFGVPLEQSAYIDPDTGRIFCVSAEIEMEGELVPDDLETSNRYISIPHKNDLNLGRDLALSFAEEELSSQYNVVAGFFQRKGAYSRFKSLLESQRLIEKWYRFEELATEKALRLWCSENGIEIINDKPFP